MDYTLRISPDALHLALRGAFTFVEGAGFCRTLVKAMSGFTQKEIRLDMAGIDYADATALGLLMQAHDVAKKQCRTLIFERPQGKLKEMLSEAALYNTLNIAA